MNNVSLLEHLKSEYKELSEKQRLEKANSRLFHRQYEKFFRLDDLFAPASKSAYIAQYLNPRKLRSYNIAIEFLQGGRFDRIERFWYDVNSQELKNINKNFLLYFANCSESSDTIERFFRQRDSLVEAKKLLKIKNKPLILHSTYIDYKYQKDEFAQWVTKTNQNCRKIIFNFSNSPVENSSHYIIEINDIQENKDVSTNLC